MALWRGIDKINQFNIEGMFDQLASGLENSKAKSYEEAHISEYMDENFGLHWSKQIEIAESVRDNKITLVRSCNDVGKTHVAASILWWWMDVYRPTIRYNKISGGCKIITTAKTFDSVRYMLWTQIREHYKMISHKFNEAHINQTDFMPDTDFPKWIMIGYNPKIEGEEATSFQGHHSPHTLFLIDEAVTTNIAIWKAIEGSIMDVGSRVLAIYNPTTIESEVYHMEQDKRGNVISISAFDLFADPIYQANKEYFIELANEDAIKDLIEIYGEDHPIVQARVFGNWPEQDENAAISVSGVLACVERWKQLEIYDKLMTGKEKEDWTGFKVGRTEKVVFAWDVSDGGVDGDVLIKLTAGSEGIKIEIASKWSNKADESDKSMAHVSQILNDEAHRVEEEFAEEIAEGGDIELPQMYLIVDTVGVGSHIPSIMAPWHPEVSIRGFKAGAKPGKISERKELVLLNKISEAWHRSHLLLDHKVVKYKEVALQPDDKLQHQLTSRLADMAVKNKEPLVWFVEPKDAWKKRNRNKSPDEADACVMSIYGFFKATGVRFLTL